MGYRVLIERAENAEVHHPVYTPEEAYWKSQISAEKTRSYESEGYAQYSEVLSHLPEYWLNSKNPIAHYVLAGLFAGIQSGSPNKPISYNGRNNDPEFESFNQGLLGLDGVQEPSGADQVLSERDKNVAIVHRALRDIGDDQILNHINLRLLVVHIAKRL